MTSNRNVAPDEAVETYGALDGVAGPTGVPRRSRSAPAEPQRSELVDGVRVIETRGSDATVVEMRRPRATCSLSRVYGALGTIGVRLAHTEVRIGSHRVVQKLYVVELDESRLSRERVGTLLQVLRAI